MGSSLNDSYTVAEPIDSCTVLYGDVSQYYLSTMYKCSNKSDYINFLFDYNITIDLTSISNNTDYSYVSYNVYEGPSCSGTLRGSYVFTLGDYENGYMVTDIVGCDEQYTEDDIDSSCIAWSETDYYASDDSSCTNGQLFTERAPNLSGFCYARGTYSFILDCEEQTINLYESLNCEGENNLIVSTTFDEFNDANKCEDDGHTYEYYEIDTTYCGDPVKITTRIPGEFTSTTAVSTDYMSTENSGYAYTYDFFIVLVLCLFSVMF